MTDQRTPTQQARSSADGFHTASAEEIRAGRVTDVYLLRAQQMLGSAGANPLVVAEVRASSLPGDWPWAVLAGLEEVATLLEGRPVDVAALPEGSLFYAEEPVLAISGRYLDFAVMETAMLGLLCQASGVATMAARCKLAAAGRPVFSFGARRVHPAIAPMVERAAFVGGCDGVSGVKSSELVGVEPVGTMSQAAPLILGEEDALRALDRVLERSTPRIALVDVIQDEKFGAVAAAEVLGERLAAVRLDSPTSRRGDLPAILREVRWELDQRGFSHVKILVSGGLDERAIVHLNRYADAYGVGGAISNAPVVEFTLDIVEVDGQPKAKRGKLSGRKHLWSCPGCGNRGIAPGSAKLGHCPRCGQKVRSMYLEWIERGRRGAPRQSAQAARDRALEQVATALDPFHGEE